MTCTIISLVAGILLFAAGFFLGKAHGIISGATIMLNRVVALLKQKKVNPVFILQFLDALKKSDKTFKL